MKGVSRNCFAKPAPWVVTKRVKQREAGFRMVQLTNLVRDEIEKSGLAPSYSEAMEKLGLDSKGHVCNIARRAEKHGLLRREGSGRNRRLRLA